MTMIYVMDQYSKIPNDVKEYLKKLENENGDVIVLNYEDGVFESVPHKNKSLVHKIIEKVRNKKNDEDKKKPDIIVIETEYGLVSTLKYRVKTKGDIKSSKDDYELVRTDRDFSYDTARNFVNGAMAKSRTLGERYYQRGADVTDRSYSFIGESTNYLHSRTKGFFNYGLDTSKKLVSTTLSLPKRVVHG